MRKRVGRIWGEGKREENNRKDDYEHKKGFGDTKKGVRRDEGYNGGKD